ncbi:MAG: Ig-like domain-containing protein [Ruminococcaceae bacterium]|nr:Ig-like domain-containing protein [Oscillospiraceae bacterium]
MISKKITRMLAVLLSICYIIIGVRVDAFAGPVIQPDEPGDTSSGIFWSASIQDNMVSKTVLTGSTKSLSSLGLSPYAIKNGVVSRSFTWTSSNSSVATVNASTGDITGVSTGTAIITGRSSAYGSSLGELLLVVFVAEELKGATYMGIDGQHNTNCSSDHWNKYYVVLEFFHHMGYSPYEMQYASTSSKFASYVATSRMFCFRNHGTQASLILNNTSITRVYTDYIYTLPANSLSYCEFAIIGSEFSGKGGAGATNMVNALHSRGVGTVVGITSNITCYELDEWLEGVFSYLNDGYTVQEACELTAESFKEWDEGVFVEDYSHTCDSNCTSRCTGYHMDNYYIAGDPNARFN